MANMANKKSDTTLQFSLKSGLMQVPAYPLHFAKVLMQLGYEPLPPFRSKTLFGKEVYYYPNIFKYLRYIYSTEGPTGLFRGLGMRIVTQMVGTLGYNHTLKIIEDSNPNGAEEIERLIRNGQQLEALVKATSKDLIARCWAVALSQPFHVMALRCMAQFIGGENNYSSWNIFQNAQEIYRVEGVAGFFSGLVPRILFEVTNIILTNSCAYMIRTYIISDKEIDSITDLASSVLASSVTYPLSVVSTVSAVSGSRLVAAEPPKMPQYATWVEAFRDLYYSNQLKRGAASIFRVYTPLLVDANSLAAGVKLA